jgi:CubicO group peptidase (beta-lactamase class C family)
MAKHRLILFSLIITILTGMSGFVQAQDLQKQKIDSVFNLLKQHINAKNVTAIYALTGSALQNKLTSQALQTFLEQQIFPAGTILHSSLVNFANNTGQYKIDFAATSLQLQLNLDEQNKIQLFLFQPYQSKIVVKKNALVATSNPMATEQDKHVDTIVRRYIQQKSTSGLSIGIIKNGQVSTYFYGETAKGNNRLPNANTVFEIASITKTYTSTLLAWYVNQGKIKLTDPITQYLPDSVAANHALQKITLLNLSNHTSGLPGLPENFFTQPGFDALDPYKNFNKKAVYSFLKTCTLQTPPGESYFYSNLAVALLGAILEKVSGLTYEKMVNTIICKPLSMKSTAINPTAQMIAQMVPAVYTAKGEPTPIWNFAELAAHGGLKSNLDDMLLYGKAQMELGKSKLAKAMQFTQQPTFNKNPKVALAWHLINIDGVIYNFHNGGTYGSSSYMAFNTDKKLLVIILSNCAESTDTTGNNIVKVLQ